MICSYCLQANLFASKQTNFLMVMVYWGGVEDTRLEAKAKDTKKSEARPKPRTAHPRTDLFEAKDRNAKDQGHKRKSSPKKSLQKFFSGDLKKRSSKNFFRRSPVKYTLLKFFFRRSTKFQQFKKSAVLELRTGQFSRTWGLEANVKDLIFEAKAKDFKITSSRTPRLTVYLSLLVLPGKNFMHSKVHNSLFLKIYL